MTEQEIRRRLSDRLAAYCLTRAVKGAFRPVILIFFRTTRVGIKLRDLRRLFPTSVCRQLSLNSILVTTMIARVSPGSQYTLEKWMGRRLVKKKRSETF